MSKANKPVVKRLRGDPQPSCSTVINEEEVDVEKSLKMIDKIKRNNPTKEELAASAIELGAKAKKVEDNFEQIEGIYKACLNHTREKLGRLEKECDVLNKEKRQLELENENLKKTMKKCREDVLKSTEPLNLDSGGCSEGSS